MILIVYFLAILSAIYAIGLELVTMKTPFPNNSPLLRLVLDFISFVLDLVWIISMIKFRFFSLSIVIIYLLRVYICYFIRVRKSKKEKAMFGDSKLTASNVNMPISEEKCMKELSEYERRVSLIFNAIDVNKTPNSEYLKVLPEYPYFKKIDTLFEKKLKSEEYGFVFKQGLSRIWIYTFCKDAKQKAEDLLNAMYKEDDEEQMVMYFKRFMVSFMSFDHVLSKPVIFKRNGLINQEESMVVRTPDYLTGGKYDEEFLEKIFTIYEKADFLNLNDDELRKGGFL